jgi:hypothetical protein
MKKVALALVGAGLLYLTYKLTNDSTGQGGINNDDEPLFSWDSYSPDPVESVEQNDPMNRTYDYKNHPLLLLIQKRESGGDYFVVFKGQRFSETHTHPYAHELASSWWQARDKRAFRGQGELRRKGIAPAIIDKGINKGKPSSAAGRYQFILATWYETALRIGKFDFSPDTQDHLAYDLCVQIGAIRAYNNGDYERAIRLAATKWTSLPSATTGEVATTMQVALNELRSFA